jgi:Calx-beta domain
MKKHRYIIPSSALLVTLIAYQVGKQDPPSSVSSEKSPQSRISSKPSSARQLAERSLAAKGLLWETVTANPRERAVKSMTIAPNSFAEAMSAEVGSAVTLRLSEKIPALHAEITNRKSETDGTIVTHLRIPGDPEGLLTIQENAAMNFFLGQLYYGNHPVAYEFKNSANSLIATRHELSELICAMIDNKELEVSQMGLPPVDKVRGKMSDEADQAAIEKAKKSIQEAKPGTGGGDTTGLTLSIADAAITEGNSGSQSLSFTVRLSKADRKKTITVGYTTANGTATAGSDYTAVSGTVTIAAGRNSAILSVPITGDTAIENDETFTVNLSGAVNAVISDAQAIGTITNDDSTPSLVPVFNSLPGAVAVAYLDMDGQVVSGTQWSGGATITARGVVGTLTNAQMLDVCRRTAEDFSAFDINVTTEESVYLAAPSDRRIRCIITPDNEWYGSAGGVAYLNSFTWTGDTPCWVFSDMLSNSPRYIAEATSHEIGHTLTLRHDGRISPSEGYYQGHGLGEIGWAPIMGVGYYKLLVQWSKGEYLSANNTEDDLSRITTLNGFGYRVDQVGNSTLAATPLTGSSGARSASGIIETGADVDVFSFSTAGGSSSFTALGDASSQDLDILLEILDGSGAVIGSANPDDLTDASVSATLSAGNYFLRVSGVGRGDVLGDGYSDYGSIGQYSISGSAP